MKQIFFIFTVLISRSLFAWSFNLRPRFAVSSSKDPSSLNRHYFKKPNKSNGVHSTQSVRKTNESKENDLYTNKTLPNKVLLEFDDIMSVILEDDSEMLNDMIKQGRVSDVNKEIYNGSNTTLLTKACELRSLGCVKVLLHNDADIHPYNTDLLLSTCMKGDVELIEVILKGCRVHYELDSIDYYILYCFSFEDVICNDEVTTVLLKYITDIDIFSNDADGENLLHLAIKYNRLSLVKALLERGIDREAEDDSGRTPLTLASRYEYIEIVKLLLSYNSTIDNTTTMSMYSVLDALADVVFYHKKFEVVRILTDYIPDSEIDTLIDALHIAVRGQHAGMTQLLITRGVDVNAVYDGRTALSYTTTEDIWLRSPEGDPAVYPGIYIYIVYSLHEYSLYCI